MERAVERSGIAIDNMWKVFHCGESSANLENVLHEKSHAKERDAFYLGVEVNFYKGCASSLIKMLNVIIKPCMVLNGKMQVCVNRV